LAVTRLRRPAVKLKELIEETVFSIPTKASERMCRPPPDLDIDVTHEGVEKPRYPSCSLGWNLGKVAVIPFGGWDALNETVSVARDDLRRIHRRTMLPDQSDERVYSWGVQCIDVALHPLE